jgi:signal transduction histidine kinase
MLTLWAWLLEYVVLLPGAARFSVGWYAGRAMGLLSGMFVLLMLLIEMSRLYARTVLLIAAQKRERENRLMLGEAVGAFIAHELRQPLAAISLTAHTAQKVGAQAGGELSALMDDLIEDSRRANDIIRSTRAIFGKSGGQKWPTDINQLVRNTLLMMSRELKNHDVKVEVQLNDHLPRVTINPMQMQQVLMNLFMNAAEAMSEVAGRPRKLTVKSSSSGAGLIIRVEDTGPSLNMSDQDRIFDPFFTTKKHGTGIGLSICRSIVDAHGGSIQMVPGTPIGARFDIILPNPDTAGSVQGLRCLGDRKRANIVA